MARSVKIRFAFFAFGLIAGLWISWPGIIKGQGWVCVAKVVNKSTKKNTPLIAVLSLPPIYFLNGSNYRGPIGKVRILGDACFR